MQSHDKKALLLNIGTDPESPWAMLVPNKGIPEPLPEIYGQEPGLYNMTWKIKLTDDNRVGVQFDLFNDKLEQVDGVILPAMQYFSGQLVAMRTGGVFNDMHSEPAAEKLKDLFPNQKNLDPMSLVNKFMHKQNLAFQEKMNEYADFDGHQNLLGNLYIMISGNLPMLDNKYLMNEDVVCLPDDDLSI